MMRSLLFVPGDAPGKMQKAMDNGADAVILDLEDSVSLQKKADARACVVDFLRGLKDASRVIIRINPLTDTRGLADEDLDAVMPYKPAMIMLPKANGGKDVQWLGAKLATHEAISGADVGSTKIIAIAPETPQAVFTLGTYQHSGARLAALTWGGGEDLSAAAGARSNRDENGMHTEPYRLVRHLSLFAAAGAGVAAIDGVFTNFRDADGARREAEAAAHDGFTGKLAIHPAQVAVYNEVFTPSSAEIEKAQAIVAAFNGADDAGVVNFNGVMLDRPHLARARATLARSQKL